MSALTVGEIVDFLQGSFQGNRSRVIRAVRPLGEAGETDLSFLSNPKYAHLLGESKAGAILVSNDTEGSSPDWIRVANPYLALARVLQRWFADIPRPAGISPQAQIHPSARVDRSARIGAFVSIGEDAVVEKDVTIFDNCFVGAGCRVGEGTLLHANVTLYHRSVVGRRCVVHAGAVLGADGFGFATAGGKHHKIPQIGRVVIEDDVEIGAGTTIDRAALGETVIGEGTKIDNLVQIGHNARIGRHCLIVSQVGVSGSTELGDYCVLGGQAGTYGHLRIGGGVQIAARSVVTKDWEGPATIGGDPAQPLRDQLRQQALVRKLPDLLRRIEELERIIESLGGSSRS